MPFKIIFKNSENVHNYRNSFYFADVKKNKLIKKAHANIYIFPK